MTVTSVTARVPAKINLQLAVGPLRRRRLPRAGDGLPRHLAVRRGDRRGRRGRQRDRGRRGRRPCARRRGQPGAARGAGASRGDRGPRRRAARRGAPTGTPGWPSRSASGYRSRAGWPAAAPTPPPRSSPATRSGRRACRHQELCEVAGRVGSDVAFAVLGGTAVGRGRGEQLSPALVAPAAYHWVLAFADGHLSTPAVYGDARPARGTDGRQRAGAQRGADGGAAGRGRGPARRGAQQRSAGPRARDVPRAAQDAGGGPGVRRARRAGLRLGADLLLPGPRRAPRDRHRGRAVGRRRVPVGGEGDRRGPRRVAGRPADRTLVSRPRDCLA